jgi:hypothetical protein
MQSILALGGTVFVLTFFLVISLVHLPERNETYINYAMGWLSGIGTMIFGYYFGSSKGKNNEETENDTNK